MKRGYTLIELLITLSIGGILFAILYPVSMRIREPRDYCRSNLKQIGIGMLQYAQDYDEQLPPAATRSRAAGGGAPPFGWAGLIQPYVMSTQLLQCAREGTASSRDARKRGFTDYWLNARLAGRSYTWLAAPERVFLCGDGNDGTDRTDARYSLASWPSEWSNESAPILRHLGTASFLFADGHAKPLKLPEILASRGFEPRFEKPTPKRKYLPTPRKKPR